MTNDTDDDHTDSHIDDTNDGHNNSHVNDTDDTDLDDCNNKS